MNKIEILIWLIVGVGVITYIPLLSILGIMLFMMFHELGHAIVASYYGAFKGFGIHGMAVATNIETDMIPEKSMPLSFCSGMFLNVLTASIIMPIFTFNKDGVAGYLLIVIGCGLGDIYCLIKKTPFTTESKIPKS
jgi:hypothetical protein